MWTKNVITCRLVLVESVITFLIQKEVKLTTSLHSNDMSAQNIVFLIMRF